MRARDSLKGVAPNMVAKLRKMIALLDNIEDAEELQALTAWKVHPVDRRPQRHREFDLTTFYIDAEQCEICNVMEDYH